MPSDYSNPVHEYSIWIGNLNENLSARYCRASNINAYYATNKDMKYIIS